MLAAISESIHFKAYMSSHAGKSAATHSPLQPAGPAAELERRLDALTGKVDVLLAAFGLSERAADARWRRAAGQNEEPANAQRDGGEGSQLSNDAARIGAQFVALRRRRDALRMVLADAAIQTERTPEREARAEAKLNPLSDQLYGSALELAAVPATEITGLRYKAFAIQEYCEERSDDIVHLLAASLATDILARGH